MGLYLIYREHELVLRLRQDWLAYGDVDTPAQARHSVVVERLPRALRSDGALRAYFELLFPGKVHSAVVCLQVTTTPTTATPTTNTTSNTTTNNNKTNNINTTTMYATAAAGAGTTTTAHSH